MINRLLVSVYTVQAVAALRGMSFFIDLWW